MTDSTRKAQHQARAQLVREGTRTLARASITDYRAANYQSALKAEQERITREVHAAQEAHVRELLGEPCQPVELGAPTARTPETTIAELDALAASVWGEETIPTRKPAYAMTPEERTAAYREAVAHATTPKPLPKPDTAAGLLARLNARHKN